MRLPISPLRPVLPAATAFLIAFLAALALFGISLSRSVPSLASGEIAQTAHVQPVGAAGSQVGQVGAIVARRAISIPYGIDSPLNLNDDGQQVTVTGHGDCTGGESQLVRVTVRQDGATAAVGHGHMQSECPQGRFQWAVAASVNGNTSFEEGEAQVCAMAAVRDVDGRTVTYHWCRDVTLTSQP